MSPAYRSLVYLRDPHYHVLILNHSDPARHSVSIMAHGSPSHVSGQKLDRQLIAGGQFAFQIPLKLRNFEGPGVDELCEVDVPLVDGRVLELILFHPINLYY